MKVINERYLAALKELAKVRRDMRQKVTLLDRDYLVQEYLTYSVRVTSRPFRDLHAGKEYKRSYDVLRYRMLKNEIRLRKIEI